MTLSSVILYQPSHNQPSYKLDSNKVVISVEQHYRTIYLFSQIKNEEGFMNIETVGNNKCHNIMYF